MGKALHKPYTRYTPPLTVTESDYVFAASEMRGRLSRDGKPWTVRTIFLYNVERVLYKHNGRHAKREKPVSEKTKANRFNEIRSMANTLHNLGYRITLPTQIRQKHVKALTHFWESRKDLMPASVVQKVSILRTFLGWMGKEGVMEFMTVEDMFANPEAMKREYVAKVDKSWDDKFDIDALIAKVMDDCKYTGRQLKLSHLFGLRAKESMLFRPQLDYDQKVGFIHVRRGTKGGRPRTVPVETSEQRQYLEELQGYCYDVNESMIPRRSDQKSWIKHYYRVTKRNGISKETGITPHGLRHGYAQRLYERTTGHPAAVKDVTQISRDIDMIEERIARLMVSENLGHSRESITSAYIGSHHE